MTLRVERQGARAVLPMLAGHQSSLRLAPSLRPLSPNARLSPSPTGSCVWAVQQHRVVDASLGLLQYISPTIQFGLGLWVFHKPFQPARLIGFVFIWAALLIYSLEGLWNRRRASLQAA